MLVARPVAFRTPHAKLKNENQNSSINNFPRTPLPPVKQLLEPGTLGKQTAQTATKSRKALGDKTPGVHLQNRGVKAINAGPDGKTLIFLDQKPPSASRKSIKKARLSDGLKTPDPATRKPHWDVSEGNIVEEVAQLSLKEDEDNDEPEYMPPTASAPLPDYDFPSGAEVGRALMEMAQTAQFDYDKPPPSFEIEAFLIPEDQLVVPLSYLAPEPIPFVEEEFPYEDITDITTNQTPVDSKTNADVKPGGRVTRSQTGSLRTPQQPRVKPSLRAPTTSSLAKAPLFSHRVQNQGARPKASARRLSTRGSQTVHERPQDQNEISSLHEDEIPSAKIHPGLAKLFEEAVVPIDDVRFDVL